MRSVEDVLIPNNTGRAFELKKGQHLRVIGESITDFVVFNLNDLTERFDQARTKTNQGKIFISDGDKLISKSNNIMMTIVQDTYKEGTHCLQKGMCSNQTYRKLKGMYGSAYDLEKLGITEAMFPDHGCWENLTEALKPWKIPPQDIPSPFNIFQTMEIDGKTGRMEFSKVRPKPGSYVELRAEMDCLVGISSCPAFGTGKPHRVQIYSL